MVIIISQERRNTSAIAQTINQASKAVSIRRLRARKTSRHPTLTQSPRFRSKVHSRWTRCFSGQQPVDLRKSTLSISRISNCLATSTTSSQKMRNCWTSTLTTKVKRTVWLSSSKCLQPSSYLVVVIIAVETILQEARTWWLQLKKSIIEAAAISWWTKCWASRRRATTKVHPRTTATTRTLTWLCITRARKIRVWSRGIRHLSF